MARSSSSWAEAKWWYPELYRSNRYCDRTADNAFAIVDSGVFVGQNG